jgi:hypothetical protein
MRHIQTITVVAGLLWAVAAPQARQAEPQRPPTPSAPRAVQPMRGPQQQTLDIFVDPQSAQDTRERLQKLLDQYPPSVRQVLRIDTSLLSRPDYLATYPTLAAFLAQHPEVAHNPAWFIGGPEIHYEERNTDPRLQALRTVQELGTVAGVILGIMTVTFGLVWIIRSLLEQRRWTRAMRAQGDLQTKLIDRFSSSDELLAYLQSPAGRALREMPVITATAGTRGMDAPLSRIFWSLQAGSVLSAAGAGLLFVADRDPLLAPPLFAIGTVVLTIGIGFIASAAISYFLSQRLGLVQSMSTRYGGEAPGS